MRLEGAVTRKLNHATQTLLAATTEYANLTFAKSAMTGAVQQDDVWQNSRWYMPASKTVSGDEKCQYVQEMSSPSGKFLAFSFPECLCYSFTLMMETTRPAPFKCCTQNHKGSNLGLQ